MRISFHKWESMVAARSVVTALGDDDIQVWIGAVPALEEGMMPYVCLLNSEERLRAEHMIVTRSKHEFVFGRGVLRQLLGLCLNIDPAKVKIDYAKCGKPHIEAGAAVSEYRFNTSHSHSLVAIALTRGREIGVDIEWIDRRVDWWSIVGRIFSSREIRELRSLPELSQQEVFFRSWTRKEAYLKATGEGLIDDMTNIEVMLLPGKPPEFLSLPIGSGGSEIWQICDIPLPKGFVGALVYEKSWLVLE